MLVNITSDEFFHCVATNWASGEDDHVVARAEFDFSAASEAEISLRTGDMINLAPKGEAVTLIFLIFNQWHNRFDFATTLSPLLPFYSFNNKVVAQI